MIAPKIAPRIAPRSLRFAVTGVLAAVSLAGCASTGKIGKVDGSAAQAQAALAQGKTGRAVNLAEASVEADPRAADKRALLGHAYLKSGRFDSAATAFDDAMSLGDNSTRTALALALAKIGAGRNAEAVALLDDWRDSIPASDLGLALALAGESSRGVAILSDAIRSGDGEAKTRQNLAYAYALAWRWPTRLRRNNSPQNRLRSVRTSSHFPNCRQPQPSPNRPLRSPRRRRDRLPAGALLHLSRFRRHWRNRRSGRSPLRWPVPQSQSIPRHVLSRCQPPRK